MKAYKIKYTLLSLAFIGLVACDTYTKEVDENIVLTDKTFSNEKVLTPGNLSNELPRDLKIIKSANVRYKVKSVKDATQYIKQYVRQYHAYISDLQFQNNLYTIENQFTIKVPQKHFDVLMDSINNSVEFIDYENITTRDVTEEYIDLESRLKTKLEVKQRYESILRKQAKTVEDILATEEKLQVLQEAIESAQGRLKYLDNKVSYSTIQIELYEAVDYKEEPVAYHKTFWLKSKDGFSFGWSIIEGITLGLVYIWPLVIIGGVIFFFIRIRSKRKK